MSNANNCIIGFASNTHTIHMRWRERDGLLGVWVCYEAAMQAYGL